MGEHYNKYWKKRNEQEMNQAQLETYKVITANNALLQSAIDNINREINKIYVSFKGKDLSQKEARKLLNATITTREYKRLQEEVKNIKDPEIKKILIKQLDAPAYASRITRLEALKKIIDINVYKTLNKRLENCTKLFIRTIKSRYYKSIYNIQKELKFEFNFAKISDKRINKILNMEYFGSNYSKRIWKNTRLLSQKLKETMTIDILTGKNPKIGAERLNNIMNTEKYNAERVIRTETTHFYNQAELESYKECNVEKYVFLATLDSRTSSKCRKMDGKIINVEDSSAGENLPPLHANCRSTTIAYLDDNTLKSLRRRVKQNNSKSYTTDKFISYENWNKKNNIF